MPRRLAAVIVVLVVAMPACAPTVWRVIGERTGIVTTTTTTTITANTTTTTRPLATGFVAFGDFGGGPAQYDVAAAMERWVESGHRADVLVTTGDNVYERGEPWLFEPQLDRPYGELRRYRPMWVTLGNHDVIAGYGDEQLTHLRLPALPYTKDLPGLQILFLDGNLPNQAQADWLASKLAAPGPSVRVVVFHQPAYSCSLHGPTPGVVQRWVPVLEKYKVDLVLTGHDHNYQRFESSGGVTYVVSGGGGRGLYSLTEPCNLAAPRVAGAKRHHFLGVEVVGGKITLTAVASDGQVIDRSVFAA